MPRPDEHVPPLSPEMAAIPMIPLCRVRGCGKIDGHADEHGPVVFNMTPIRSQFRWWHKLTRNYLYGLSRANEWPLWASWMLAPNAAARGRVKTLMEIERGTS